MATLGQGRVEDARPNAGVIIPGRTARCECGSHVVASTEVMGRRTWGGDPGGDSDGRIGRKTFGPAGAGEVTIGRELWLVNKSFGNEQKGVLIFRSIKPTLGSMYVLDIR